MKLYQLRRLIRLHGDFSCYVPGAAQEWGRLIDATARHIYQEWSVVHQYPVVSYPFPDHGYDVQYAKQKPLTLRVWSDDEPLTMPSPDRVTIRPERIKYGDGKGRFIRVVFGIADQTFFVWELGGLSPDCWQRL